MTKFKAIAVWLLIGAAAGTVFGLMVISSDVRGPEEVRGRRIVIAAFALTGAAIAGASAIGVIRATSWTMIAGATLGAVIAIVVNGNGKAALYGVPIGTAAGFVVSMAMASHSEQSVDKPIDRQAERFNEP